MLAAAATSVNVEEVCRGKTLAVDASGWLHKMACNADTLRTMVLDGEYAPLVRAFQARAAHYSRLGIQLVVVFDGEKYPGKARVDESRKKKREDAAAKIEVLVAEGKDVPTTLLNAAVTISWELVEAVIFDVLRRLGIPYFVAPYEADHMVR